MNLALIRGLRGGFVEALFPRLFDFEIVVVKLTQLVVIVVEVPQEVVAAVIRVPLLCEAMVPAIVVVGEALGCGKG